MSPACIRSSQGPRAPQGQVLASRAALLPGQTAAPGARRSTEISRNKHPQHPKHQPRCEAGQQASRRGEGRAPQGKHGLGVRSQPEALPHRDRARGASAASRRQGQALRNQNPRLVSRLLTRTEICWSPGSGHTRVTRGGTQRRCFPASPGLSACTSAAAGPARAPGIPAWPRQAAGAELSLASW